MKTIDERVVKLIALVGWILLGLGALFTIADISKDLFSRATRSSYNVILCVTAFLQCGGWDVFCRIEYSCQDSKKHREKYGKAVIQAHANIFLQVTLPVKISACTSQNE